MSSSQGSGFRRERRGNRYRLLIVAVYAAGTLGIRWIGTHAEYDKLNL